MDPTYWANQALIDSRHRDMKLKDFIMKLPEDERKQAYEVIKSQGWKAGTFTQNYTIGDEIHQSTYNHAKFYACVEKESGNKFNVLSF